jgi:glycosyltransferase involved in cell wall biosynthesis
MISIVIPAYNYGQFLPEAIESVLAQGIEDIEILISDDASTDNTPDVIADYARRYPCVRGERNPVNLGAVPNFNQAVAHARGDYVLVIGADDYFVPGALAALKATLDAHPECGFVYGRYNVQDEGGRMLPLQHPGWAPRSYFGDRDEFSTLLEHDCYINIGTTLFRRSVLADRAAFFDPTLQSLPGERFFRGTDWDLVLDLSLHNIRGAFLDQQISVFRQHSSQASGQDRYAASGVAITEHLVLLDRYLTEETLPRVAGRLVQIFALVCGKFGFYCQCGRPVSVEVDDEIRRRFHAFCLRFEQLLAHDPLSAAAMPAALRTVLEKAKNESAGGGTAPATLTPDSAEAPFFSVVMTTYNRPRLLQDALASVLDQSCQDFEILVVNDGGPEVESSLAWAGEAARITYVRQPNRGPSAARNAALRLARGRYIVYLDDDDLMRRDHLDTLRGQLAVTPAAVVYTSAEYVPEELRGGKRVTGKPFTPYQHDAFDYNRLQVSNYIPINTFCHPRALLEKTGMFDENLHALEDWDLLIRMSRATHFVHINRLTVEVRQRTADLGQHQTNRQFDSLRDLFARLYERYDDQGNLAVRGGRAIVLAAEHPTKAKLGTFEYQYWQDAHGLREVDAEILAERMVGKWHRRPVFNLIVRVPREHMEALGATLQSLQQQFYNAWRLVVIADQPAPSPVFNGTDLLGWVEVGSLDDDAQVTTAFNSVVTDRPGDWVALLPPGTELSAECLLRVADFLQGKEQLAAVYTDHDQVAMPGSYLDPWFKPAFNLEYLTSFDYIDAACFFNQQTIMNLGGFAAFPGKEGYELLLRMADRYGDAAIAHLAYPMVHLPRQQETTLSLTAQRVAVEGHLQRIGRAGQVLDGAQSGIFKTVYPIDGTPLVSVIIPNRDRLEFLQPCIEGLFARTRYRHFEVLVIDNQSTDPDVLNYYADITQAYPQQVRVLAYDAPFNFSAQCNLGASQARGAYLLFLNNDIEMVQEEWLERLLMHAQRNEVGIVGAKLVYPETGMVQHAGIVLGNGQRLLSVANHYGQERKLDEPGYMNRLQCDLYLSAVTGACMMVRKSVFDEVSGFDESLSVLFNDVEFCLRVGRLGYKLLWTPYSILVHHHGISVNARLHDPVEQGRFAERSRREHEHMFAHWRKALANDPAYNRNLSLRGVPLSYDSVVPCSWDTGFDERPRIMGLAVQGGSGEYRVRQPLTALAVAGKAQETCVHMESTGNMYPNVLEIERALPNVLVAQNAFNDVQIEALRLYKQYFPDMLRVLTLDDLLTDLPEKSSLYKHIKAHFRDGRRRLRASLEHADRLIVTTEPLAECASELIGDIHIIPNYLPKAKWWGLRSLRRAGRKPRVGWVGAQQHKGDLELIHEVVRATAHEVEWVFMGMWPEGLDAAIVEKRGWVSFTEYPAAMASLNLDLAIAPLEVNAFNESKSNLRLLEYGAMGWPVVCSDILPYQTDNAPVKRVPNDPAAWIAAIRERIYDPDAAEQEGDLLRQWVGRRYLLEDNLDEWMLAYSR